MERAGGEQDVYCAIASPSSPYLSWLDTNMCTVLDPLSGKPGNLGFLDFRIFWILDLYAEEF
jgi:hypothetical protein